MASEIRYLFLIAGKKPRAAEGAVRQSWRGAYPRQFLRPEIFAAKSSLFHPQNDI